MPHPSLLFAIFATSVLGCAGQGIRAQDANFTHISSLFNQWDTEGSPGAAVAVFRNGRVVFAEAYGYANLEYDRRITTRSVFPLASISKQMTAYAILILEQEGRLSLGDPIQRYLPGLHDDLPSISIGQLVHHTSGFRDLAELFLLAGWHQSDVAFSTRVEQLAYNQSELNFLPGTRFEYSNTGYFLLSQIVEAVTDQAFADWMHENVFSPLEMTSTRVQDQYGRLIDGRVSSYQQVDGVFSRSPLTSEEVGATGVHSTIEDLTNWMAHLLEGQIGDKHVYELMSRTGRLLDGTDVGYGFGLTVDEFNGHRRISHGGRTSGILGNVAVFPDHNLGVVVLSNVYPSDPLLDPTALSMQIVEPLLPTSEFERAVEESAPEVIPLRAEEADRVSGWYWSEDSNYLRRIYVRNDTLRYYRNANSESALVPIGNDTYRMLGTQSVIEVSFLPHGQKAETMMFRANNGPPSTSFASQGPFSPTHEQLSEYEGHYYSPELQTGYAIRRIDDALSVFHPSRQPLKLQPIITDHFKGGDPWWFGYDTTFTRDVDGDITGFVIQNFHLKNVRFTRI